MFVGLAAAPAGAQLLPDTNVTVIQGYLVRCVIVTALPPATADSTSTSSPGKNGGDSGTTVVVLQPAVDCWDHVEFISKVDDPFVIISEQ